MSAPGSACGRLAGGGGHPQIDHAGGAHYPVDPVRQDRSRLWIGEGHEECAHVERVPMPSLTIDILSGDRRRFLLGLMRVLPGIPGDSPAAG
jgi:hypothetical protein